MAILPILIAPDKRLKRKSSLVRQVNDETRLFLDDLAETMYSASGIGLAAPQVGVLKRIIVVDVAYFHERHERRPIFFINPEIIAQEGDIVWSEGCLSVPDQTASVNRSAFIKVRALDREGRSFTLEAEDLLAVCVQHEIDHLSGILFIDHVSRLKRSMILQKLKKARNVKEEAEAA